MMPVNDFETTETSRSQRNIDHTNFDFKQNTNYRYKSAEALLEDTDTIIKMIQDHAQNQVPRLAVLDDYYKAKNTNIKTHQRRKELDKADHRPAHNFAKMGCQFDVGYNTGNEIKFESEDKNTLDMINEFNEFNDVDSLHGELWLDMDKYGRAYELQYRDEEFDDYVVISNVFETFVVYDTTVRRNPILAVRYPKTQFGEFDDGIKITVYTDKEIIEYQETTLSAPELREENRNPHHYQMVPILEAQPNRYRQGLYEDVLSLIDLYDAAQADTANYMTDLSNAILVIQGDVEASGMTTDDLIKQKNANMLILENGVNVDGKQTSLTAGYIYKQYDVQGTEAYKKRLVNDIHTIMNIPNLDDEHFSGVASGESMKYKLLGFEQMTKVKQRLFDKFLRRRYELLFNIKKEASEVTETALDELVIQFTPNLPKAVKEELEMLVAAGATFSQYTLRGLASFVDDNNSEEKRLIEELQTAPQYDMDRDVNEPI